MSNNCPRGSLAGYWTIVKTKQLENHANFDVFTWANKSFGILKKEQRRVHRAIRGALWTQKHYPPKPSVRKDVLIMTAGTMASIVNVGFVSSSCPDKSTNLKFHLLDVGWQREVFIAVIVMKIHLLWRGICCPIPRDCFWWHPFKHSRTTVKVAATLKQNEHALEEPQNVATWIASVDISRRNCGNSGRSMGYFVAEIFRSQKDTHSKVLLQMLHSCRRYQVWVTCSWLGRQIEM